MGGTEEVGEKRYLCEGKGRGAGSYAEGTKCGDGRFGIAGCGAGGGYEGVGRGG